VDRLQPLVFMEKFTMAVQSLTSLAKNHTSEDLAQAAKDAKKRENEAVLAVGMHDMPIKAWQKKSWFRTGMIVKTVQCNVKADKKTGIKARKYLFIFEGNIVRTGENQDDVSINVALRTATSDAVKVPGDVLRSESVGSEDATAYRDFCIHATECKGQIIGEMYDRLLELHETNWEDTGFPVKKIK